MEKVSNVRSHHPGCSNNATSLISTDFLGIGFFGVICHDRVHGHVHRGVLGPDHGLVLEVLQAELPRELQQALLEQVLPQPELVQLARPVSLQESRQELEQPEWARLGSQLVHFLVFGSTITLC